MDARPPSRRDRRSGPRSGRHGPARAPSRRSPVPGSGRPPGTPRRGGRSWPFADRRRSSRREARTGCMPKPRSRVDRGSVTTTRASGRTPSRAPRLPTCAGDLRIQRPLAPRAWRTCSWVAYQLYAGTMKSGPCSSHPRRVSRQAALDREEVPAEGALEEPGALLGAFGVQGMDRVDPRHDPPRDPDEPPRVADAGVLTAARLRKRRRPHRLPGPEGSRVRGEREKPLEERRAGARQSGDDERSARRLVEETWDSRAIWRCTRRRLESMSTTLRRRERAAGRRQPALDLVRLQQPPQRLPELLVAEIGEPGVPPGGAQQALLLERGPDADPREAPAHGVRPAERAGPGHASSGLPGAGSAPAARRRPRPASPRRPCRGCPRACASRGSRSR